MDGRPRLTVSYTEATASIKKRTGITMVWMNEPRVVVTIHGIRTYGEWQKRITPHLARHGLVPYHIHYGWFGVLKFLFAPSRKRQVQAVRQELRDLVDRVGARRVSVIAHSFGTYLAMEALVKDNGGLQYDRVVLTGSIVPRDFNWQRVIAQNKWVVAVWNERATSDLVVTFAQIASRYLKWIFWLQAGDSGRNPFLQKLPVLLDDFVDGDHSETHNPQKFDRWARFIAYPNLPDDVLQKVKTEMQALRQEAAAILEQDPTLLRVNLFAPLGGALRIVPGAVDNMNYVPEFTLVIEPSHGATGTAFTSGNPCLVVKRGRHWSVSHLPGDQLEKVHPNLKWVLSLPIKSEPRDTVVGVINVDGLDNQPPMLEDSESEECQAAILALFYGMLKRFQPCLDATFRGDKLAQIEG